jgi:hypothetical protein
MGNKQNEALKLKRNEKELKNCLTKKMMMVVFILLQYQYQIIDLNLELCQCLNCLFIYKCTGVSLYVCICVNVSEPILL